MAVDVIFGRFIHNNLRYWCSQVERLNAPHGERSADDVSNATQAIRFGLTSPEQKHHKLAIQLQLDLFSFFENQHVWHSAINNLERALILSEFSVEQHIQLLNQLGAFYRVCGQPKQAAHLHKEALSLVPDDVHAQLAQCHFYLATAYYRLHDFALAYQHGELASQLSSKDTSIDISFIASLNNTLGLILMDSGDNENALLYLQRALLLWEKTNNTNYHVITLNNLGIANDQLGNIANALAFFDLGLELVENTATYVRLLLNKGDLLNGIGSFDKALRVFQVAESSSFRNLPDLHLQASLDNNIGYSLIELSRPFEALSYLDRAYRKWEMLNDKLYLANTLGEMGRAHLKLGNIEEGQHMLNTAIRKLAQFPDQAWAIEFKRGFERVLEKLASQSQTD